MRIGIRARRSTGKQLIARTVLSAGTTGERASMTADHHVIARVPQR